MEENPRNKKEKQSRSKKGINQKQVKSKKPIFEKGYKDAMDTT